MVISNFSGYLQVHGLERLHKKEQYALDVLWLFFI